MWDVVLLALTVMVGFPSAYFAVQVWLEDRYDRQVQCREPERRRRS
jgi:hypothetical protein